MEMVTLYTCDSGYSLYQAGKSFAASKETYTYYDYVVKTPAKNIREVREEDVVYYEVVDLNEVTVTLSKMRDKE